jgi:hypothetical protein
LQYVRNTPSRVHFAAPALLLLVTAMNVLGQGPGQAPAQPAHVTAKAAAPVDLTGYWVSLITEDWRYRMANPPKGDYAAVPLNAEGRKVADSWDPVKDEGAGVPCKIYGAAGLMRLPERLHITWQDDETLKLETDAGSQTRLFSFTSPGGHPEDWQGVSIVSWDRAVSTMGFALGLGANSVIGGSLKVVTTKMKPGYLRKNGVPYSADAVLTEFFDRFDVPNSESLLVVSTEVVDPMYLARPFWTSTHFKKQNDAAGWSPSTCSAKN